jgi:hypothetical protein
MGASILKEPELTNRALQETAAAILVSSEFTGPQRGRRC